MLVAGYLPVMFGNSVLLMLVMSSMGGFYIANIHPKKLVVETFPVIIRLEGKTLNLIDLLTHHLPLLYGLAVIERTGPLAPFFLITIAYLTLNDPAVLYGFSNDATNLFTLCLVMTTVLYLVFIYTI